MVAVAAPPRPGITLRAITHLLALHPVAAVVEAGVPVLPTLVGRLPHAILLLRKKAATPTTHGLPALHLHTIATQ